MKLGDVLPHWLFREKAGIGAEIGGSVFAHLTEVGGRITFDGDAIILDNNASLTWLYPGETDLYASAVDNRALAVGLLADLNDASRLQIMGDGSIRLGDGTNSPDVSLKREASEGVPPRVLIDGGFRATGLTTLARTLSEDHASVNFALHDNGLNNTVPVLSEYETHPDTSGTGAFGSYTFRTTYSVLMPAGGHFYVVPAVPNLPPGYELLLYSAEYAVTKSDGLQAITLTKAGLPTNLVADGSRLALDWTAPAYHLGADLSAEAANNWVLTAAGGHFLVQLNARVAMGAV